MSNTDGAAPAAAGGGELSIAQAVGILNTPPEKRKDEPATPPPEEPRAAPEESPDEGDDAEAEQPPGEEPEADDEAEEPPVQPPRTWTKAEKEAFALLPREHQQSIVDRESERDSYYQRGLNEAAEKSRAAQAAQQAAEQKQRELDQALPELSRQFNAAFRNEFADIKTWDDLLALQANDPMRAQRFALLKEQDRSYAEAAQSSQQRQYQEHRENLARWSAAEDAKTVETLAKEHPELGDIGKVGPAVRQTLIDTYGIPGEALQAAWENGELWSLRDSRLQRILIDAHLYRNAKQAAKTAPRKPVPPVQRPGTATNRGEASAVSLKILSDKLSRTGRIEDAVAYQNAKTARRR